MSSFESSHSIGQDFSELLSPVYLETVFEKPLTKLRIFVEAGSFYIPDSTKLIHNPNLIKGANALVRQFQKCWRSGYFGQKI